MKAALRKTVLGRWIIVHPELDDLAWSGSRWVEIDERGFGRDVQVSNFATLDDACNAATEYGFYTVSVPLED